MRSHWLKCNFFTLFASVENKGKHNCYMYKCTLYILFCVSSPCTVEHNGHTSHTVMDEELSMEKFHWESSNTSESYYHRCRVSYTCTLANTTDLCISLISNDIYINLSSKLPLFVSIFYSLLRLKGLQGL